MTATVVVDIVGRDSFSATLGNFGNIMTGISSAVNLVGDAFRAFTGFAMEGLDAIASYERLEMSLTSLVASQMVQAGVAEDVASAMGVASLKAEELVKWNEQLAINSPFTSEGVAQAFRMAMAYGFTTEEAKRLTEAMIDFAAGSGASEYAMQQIARALGQISATGRLTGGDMLQLVNAGLPVAEILADAFGVTTAEIMKMREQGLIPAQDAIEAITVYLETNFAGAAQAQATSWAGLKGTFEDLKAMGLREFFGGLFDALQPFAIAFSTWLQGPGMTLLGTLGDILGGLVTNVLDKFSEFAPVMEDINESFLLFSGLIQIGLSPLEAFQKVLEKLSTAWDGTALGNIIDQLQEFIQTAQTEGLADAFRNLFSNIFSDFDLEETVQNLVNNLTRTLGGSDFAPLGKSLADVISGALLNIFEGLHTIVSEVNWQPLGQALSLAFGELMKGMFSSQSGQALDQAFGDWSRDLWQSMEEGLQNGINSIDLGFQRWADEKIIQPIKRALGIASPSSVFASIGRDIVLGLIGGLGTMAGTLLNMVTGLVDIILAPLQPILDLLGIGGGTGSTGGIDTSGSGWSDRGGGTGTAGSGTGGTPAGGAVVNNFYGAVYFGDMGQLGYDCPSPHPLMTASSQSLLTSGLE
jgi:tape measure domain-containing protein